MNAQWQLERQTDKKSYSEEKGKGREGDITNIGCVHSLLVDCHVTDRAGASGTEAEWPKERTRVEGDYSH